MDDRTLKQRLQAFMGAQYSLTDIARNATTDIYIRRDLSKVDDANAKVIAFVLSKSEK